MLVHTTQAPQPKWGYSDTTKQRPRDTELMYLCEQRAFDSPEPEGSEMMLHHSKFILSEKIYL